MKKPPARRATARHANGFDIRSFLLVQRDEATRGVDRFMKPV
jgi:hypothetical protein